MHYNEIVERLMLGGLQTDQFFSGDTDEIVIKVRASLSRLEQAAESSDLRFLCNEEYLEAEIDDPEEKIADDPYVSRITPYEHIYCKFSRDTDAKLYVSI
jgi:hypothetical protein